MHAAENDREHLPFASSLSTYISVTSILTTMHLFFFFFGLQVIDFLEGFSTKILN
jgi:hypothetical protein